MGEGAIGARLAGTGLGMIGISASGGVTLLSCVNLSCRDNLVPPLIMRRPETALGEAIVEVEVVVGEAREAENVRSRSGSRQVALM
jgi:hypothetical protein